MRLIEGWIDQAIKVPSPNFNCRPDGSCVSLLVIHNISLPPGEYGGSYIEDFFRNSLDLAAHPYFETIKGMAVSAHFLVKRSGELVQFVSTLDRAWHAGQSCFCEVENCNDYSIGIELEGCDDQPYEQAQYQVLAALTSCIAQHYPAITDDRIVGHSDIAPDRKTDPGEAFDWASYRELIQAARSVS